MNEKKTMQFANFNVTFGEMQFAKPMLTYFKDIIYPAFRKGYIRGTKNGTKFYFSDVKIKFLQGEYVLVGNIIKDTYYEVKTQIENEELVDSPALVPTAPYSRFMLFLKNHRMVLLKNENNSPELRNFRSTIKMFIYKQVHEYNKDKNKQEKIPFPDVNIEGKALKGALDVELAKFKKINKLIVRVFPLNNDFDTDTMVDAIRHTVIGMEGNSANITVNGPKSHEGVKEFFDHSDGKISVTALGIADDDSVLRLDNDKLSTKSNIPYNGNITAEKDDIIRDYVCKYAKEMINELSSENTRLYNGFVETYSENDYR